MTAQSTQNRRLGTIAWAPLLLASTMLTGIAPAMAQETQTSTSANEDIIVVTAQKVTQDIQDVPMSIQALGTERLEQLNVSSFNDYAQFLPSLTFQSLGPGFARTFMRGVASGDNGNHSGPLPSVGIYLDEQPVTTVTGALDVHVYDVARVEALAGPQGTLYGASSLAGTIRIITNQPDPSHLYGGFTLEANAIAHGDPGGTLEGFVNIPISSNVAVRLVGWEEHEGGYIDNVPGTRTYPTCEAGPNDGACTISNAGIAKNNYNPVDTYGGRAALRIDLNESWTITPAIMAQDSRSQGVFAFDPHVGDLQVTHFLPEDAHDNWYQAALTINGTISNLDLTYAGAYMRRAVDSHADYSDYSFFYDTLAGYYMYDETGVQYTDPSQAISGRDRYTKESHELRLATPADNRLRVIGGLFYERQVHQIEQRYVIAGMFDDFEVPGWPDTIWLTEQTRIDRDWAAFGQVAFDFTDKLTGTVGLRAFKSHNTLLGFFGYGAGFSSGTGEAACFDPTPFRGAPCVNLDRGIEENGTTHSVNLTYHFTPDVMVYGTWSTGFRPGGVNRRIFQQALYKSDTLTNYELGFKSVWDQNRFRFNAAVFQEDWEDFQFSFLGANGLTENRNAGNARIRGVEADLTWRPVENFTLTAAASYLHGEIRQNYCSLILPAGTQTTDCPSTDPNDNPHLLAPSGTQLPVTPDVKADLTARQEFFLMGEQAYWQIALVHQSGATQDLRTYEGGIIGELPAYTSVDLSTGFTTDYFSLDVFVRNATDERGELYRYTECQIAVCGAQYYVAPIQPRTIGVRFSKGF
ncbi:MAG TPA: TonB-dependent receptor [Caulobacterales bacterium]|nr:TonB-dependent receptor [Caulobacterales bacterium]